MVGKLGHDYNAVVTAPTCTEQGYTTHTCSRCDDTYTDSEVAEFGHKPGTEADCLNDQTCTVCGEVLTEKLGHNYNAVVTDPTCTEQGYTTHTCSRCDDIYTDSETEALGHTEGAEADCLNDQVCTVCGEVLVGKLGHDYNAVITHPTCTEKGYTTHTCSRCGDTYTDREVDALGHTASAEADCLNDQICTVCGAVLAKKLGHDYQAVVTAPTCTEQGYTTHTCSRCDDTYTDSEVTELGHKPGTEADCLNDQTCTVCGAVLTGKLGHDYNAIVTAPTCTEKGYTTHTCSRCNDTYTDSETEALGHDYNSVVTVPTCTKQGCTIHTCSRCDESYTDSETEALGHTPGAEADCLNDQLCTVCGIVLAEKLGHDYVAVVTNPTCTEIGYTTHTCSRCNAIYTDSEVEPRHIPGAPANCENDQICTACGVVLVEKHHDRYIYLGYFAPTCTKNGGDSYFCLCCYRFYTENEEPALGHISSVEADCLNDQVCTVCGEVLIEKLGHDYNSVVTDPTCTEKGYTTYTCSRCGDTYTDSEVAELGHTPSAQADCLNDQTCTICGEVLVGKLGHDYNAVVTAPTCTEKGYITHTCSRCGDAYTDSETEALGHKPGAEADCLNDQICTVCGAVLTEKLGHDYVAVATEPTCTEKGYTTHTCSCCGNIYTDSEVAALGHKPGAEADCLNNQTCTVCGEVLKGKLGHDYVAVVTAPTCTEKGYTTHTCSRCDDTYTDSEVDALSHKPGVEADCLNDQLCTVCGEVLTEKLGHDYVAVVTAPTCTEQGYTTHTCSRCNDTYIDSEVNALGHKPGAEADCLNDQTCIVCGEVLKGKLGHDYNAVVTDPTCTEQGYTTHTCSRCNDTYIGSEVNALGHKPGAEADCLNDQTCTVCGEVLKDKLGHDYNAVVIDPTCTKQGYTTHTCSRCDDTYTDSEVAELGHKTGAEADCINDQLCTVCGEVLTVKLGHDYNSVVTAPTCTENGYTTHTCSRCADIYTDSETETTGHTPGEWIVDQGPAPGIEGSKHTACTICHAVLEEAVIEALPEETEQETELPTEPETETDMNTEPEEPTETESSTTSEIPTDSESKTEEPESSSGCTSTVSMAVFDLILLAAIASMLLIKRRKENY